MQHNMQVVILCGGLGTRLREETEFRPKPMVNIGDRPILWHIMKIYAHYGYHEFVLALGYKGDMIKNYFCNYELMNNDVTIELGRPEKLCIHQTHDEKGWLITLANTGEEALKGARLKKIQKYIHGDTFMMTYGDGIANVDLNELLSFHKGHGRLATMTGINRASQFGELKIKENRVQAIREKHKNNNGFINGGFFVFNGAIFDYVTEGDSCDFEIGPLEEIARRGELMVYKHRGFWACMDTLRDVDYLNRMWNEGKPAWKVW